VPYTKGDFYRGYSLENENSLVALSFYDNEIGGIFSISGLGNFNVSIDKANPGVNNENYIIYKEDDVKNKDKRTGCDLDEKHQLNKEDGYVDRGGIIVDEGTCRNLTISLYGDYELYLANSSNLTNSQNYLTTLFNGNATLYENENIHVELSNATVHTAPDGTPGTSSGAVLDAFGEMIQTHTTGDLMQIVTAHQSNGGTFMGGLAWLDVLCDVPRYSTPNRSWVGPFSMVNNDGIDNIPFAP